MLKIRENGMIQTIEFADFSVPFSETHGTSIVINENGTEETVILEKTENGYAGTSHAVAFLMQCSAQDDGVEIIVSATNRSEKLFSPRALSLRLGIDTYMDHYPQWNLCFFPSLLRCEKTHFYGYFMSPEGNILGIGSRDPIAAYSLIYNQVEYDGVIHYGHRIYTVDLHLLTSDETPQRYPKGLISLSSGETLTRRIKLFPIENPAAFEKTLSEKLTLPILSMNRYTVAMGEDLHLNVFSEAPYTVKAACPDGRTVALQNIKADAIGEYIFTVTTDDGKIAKAKALCHRPWSDFLKGARQAAFDYPQKATTHAESYYGFYSAFLAAKHFPMPLLDKALFDHFNEVMPLMFDMQRAKPLLIPQRIQNTSTMIGILVDLYESDPSKYAYALEQAGRFGDFLVSSQSADGVYRNGWGHHYTCVIYIAKSMLELALTEKQAGGKFAARSEKHYESVRRAVDELVFHLDDIGTEGEATFEDGMISCSALQIGMFALTLPHDERAPYIRAAEYMLQKHRCLENIMVPDYRMNGGSLRFWEAQYDVMRYANFMNSPHGWTAWTAYATYYLYLLTGKEAYLLQTYNTMGACTSLLSEDGTLHWAFCVDPIIRAECFNPDKEQSITDAYENVPQTPAYRAKTEERLFGECYIPMISDWYRTGEAQRRTGGYATCPLIMEKEDLNVDAQGGACDNDVHEIFKCLEETLMGKVFVIERNGIAYTVGGESHTDENGTLVIDASHDTRTFHINSENGVCVSVNGRQKDYPKGLYFDML